MRDCTKFYIDGQWVPPAAAHTLEVINPATEAVAGVISLGRRVDVDRAVAAAQRAFASFSRTTREERMALLAKIIAVYERRLDDMAAAISEEMGAPLAKIAKAQQAPAGLGHFKVALAILKDFEFEKQQGTTRIVREPVGVCGLITPWNWPANQIACKVAPALACGCTMVLKPSEIAPFSGHIIAEILHEAGVPPGVFNLVDGDGPTVGASLSAHPGIDMVSFTGSTRAGILVDKAAADTVKKVSLELGGKSPNIILEGAPLEQAVGHGVLVMMNNTGQSCNAPSRMLVPRKRLAAGRGDRSGRRGQGGRRRSGRSGDRHGSAVERAAVAPGAGADRAGHQGRRQGGLWRSGPSRGARRAATTRGRRSSATSATT